MNVVAEFLASERERLELDRYGIAFPPSFVVLTQRNWTSKYVVFVLLVSGSRRPALVAKVVRVPGFGDGWLEREAANLEAAQAARAGGFATLPRLVALAAPRGRPLLVQTALVGRAMDPGVVRRNRRACVEGVLRWLRELPVNPAGARDEPDWFERLIERPIRRFGEASLRNGTRQALVERTLDLVEPLRAAQLPLVLEHGDVSHPNLIVLGDGRIGVIDWELADPRGLPLTDLVFFLTYVAFASRRSDRLAAQLRAFDTAFFGPNAWAGPIVAGEAERLGVTLQLLTPLFVACWARYVAKLGDRLQPEPPDDGAHETAPALAAAASVDASNYAALWRHALERSGDLTWRGSR